MLSGKQKNKHVEVSLIKFLKVKDNLLTILEDKYEEAEIRIAAYQGVMRCACSHSLLRIQTVLNAEEVNQGRIDCLMLAEDPLKILFQYFCSW